MTAKKSAPPRPASASKRKWTIEEILAEATPAKVRAVVILDAEAVVEIDRLEEELGRVATLGPQHAQDASALAEKLNAARDRAKAAEAEFVFQALGASRWRKLVQEHPPPEYAKAAGLDYHPETLPPVAMAACAVSPTMTPEEVVELSERLSLQQFSYLWDACRVVNVGDVRPPRPSALARQILAASTKENRG